MRERTEIERLLRRAYGADLAVDRLLPGLATVTAALNANDPGLARIAAVHLRIPGLPDQAARDRLEAENTLIKSMGRQTAPLALEAVSLNSTAAADGSESFLLDAADGFRKASPDDPKHPAGQPARRAGVVASSAQRGIRSPPSCPKCCALSRGTRSGLGRSPSCGSLSNPRAKQSLASMSRRQ